MKPILAIASLLTILAIPLHAQPNSGGSNQGKYRRGEPTTAYPRNEFYIVDSDDDFPLKPTYRFADTTYGTWLRVTGFSNTDDGYARLSNTVDSILLPYFTVTRSVLHGGSISTNGTICLDDTDASPKNVTLPSTAVAHDLVAPLWADWELRTTGDSSKIFVRPVRPDSFYVSFYNMGLKGTNGHVRATFQVLFCARDTSITYEYKSFDGSWHGVPAARLIQQVATIGMMENADTLGAMYLHKGYYYATNPSSTYALNLHNGLAVRFFRQNEDAFQVSNITNPPYDHYEVPANTITPSCTIQNMADTSIMVTVYTQMTDLTSGISFYGRYDSILVGGNQSVTYTAPGYSNLGCGSHKVTFTISYNNNISDQYSGNNTFTRYFSHLNTQTSPIFEEFSDGISPCTWVNTGAEVRDAASVMYVPDAPVASSLEAVVLNRLDASGRPYPEELAGDTLTSAPIDLSGQTEAVYVNFHYQRGLMTDSSQAGILARINSGPEIPVRSAAGGMAQAGDSLVIQGLRASGNSWNPTDANWSILGAIPGGFDVTTQTFRIRLDSVFLHDHFRLRFLVKARNAESPQNYFEDADNFVIDAVHVQPLQPHKTELEPIDLDLGSGIYTHIPRDLTGGLIPKVHLMNNGDGVPLGLGLIHLVIHDALGRAVYDRTQPFSSPVALTDSIYPMPAWDIRGSQGGTFTARVTLEAMYYDSYFANDTNVFYKTMYIDDSYGLDDGQPDSLVGTTTASPNFYYDFTPISSDSLRGVAFYYTGVSNTSNWVLTITWDNNTATRSFYYSPLSPGLFRASFPPFPMVSGTTYRLHFVMNSGSNLAGDASKGLVYYTQIDLNNSANDQYGTLHPDVLSRFSYDGITPYTQPRQGDGAAGGFLLPMFRVLYSGALNYLPVELASLNAVRNADGTVTIGWKTAMESKAYNYEIRRVSDNSLAGTYPAKNASNGAEYLLIDRMAPATEVTYDLVEHDLDGSQTSLGRVTAGSFGTRANLSISAYPNPSSGTLRVYVSPSSSEDAELPASIQLIDPLGRVVKNILTVTGEAILETWDLPAGSYLIVGSSASGTTSMKVAIVH